ncbi:MAG TPA: 3'(2'),5'-bisphosphate nucleotidase CysQ [Chitinophagales bacterium]|nr:3'(2'),5'-bisphosphate nucleotidase CysQ [Chitinophagales bacterium]
MTYKEIDIDALVAIAVAAGDAIMEVYNRSFTVEVKDDKSPLTEADKKSNAVILEKLNALYPQIPFISEESKQTPYAGRQHWSRLWLIDPLDGTKEFIKRNGEFTVNIALIEDGVPVVGVVHAPAKGTTYYGVKGEGAFKITGGVTAPISNTVHYSQKQKVIVVGSRSHLDERTEAFVQNLRAEGKEVEFSASGSSLKFCMVAEGAADVYPRFGPTMEWDTAAAHAVALYAGKNVLHAETRQPVVYNKPDLYSPFFIVE